MALGKQKPVEKFVFAHAWGTPGSHTYPTYAHACMLTNKQQQQQQRQRGQE